MVGKQQHVAPTHMYRCWTRQGGLAPALQVVDAEGVYLLDKDGKQYLDFSSQLMCSNLGHKNQAIISAICEQARRLPYVSPSFGCAAKDNATAALGEVMPEGINAFFFSPSGTEANEAAIKMVRQFSESTGRYKLISRYRSYHGATAGSISLTGEVRRWFAEPSTKIPGVVFAPDAYCYRCPFGLSHPSCGIQCAEYVAYMIKEEGNVAAMFVEPVVGTNGVIVPPDEYLPRLRQIADENEVLLVADEVMSGWYRTGKAFAVNHWGVTPDILTTAKGCTGAYTPVGITATTERIYRYFGDHYFGHGHTYSEHPLTLSAIPAAIDEYHRLFETGTPQRAAEHLAQQLQSLKARHECVGDVRGLGHFWAIELVRDRRSKEPFNTKEDQAALKPLMTSRLSAQMLKDGVYVAPWLSHLVVAPPLIITDAEIDRGVEVIDACLSVADREVRGA